MKRRQLLQAGLAIGGAQVLALQSLWAAAASLPAKTQVIVIGGGYGGATAAKYIRMLSNYKISEILTGYLRMENLTNAHYQVVHDFGTAGRSFLLGLKAKW